MRIDRFGLVIAILSASVAPLIDSPPAPVTTSDFPGWPTHFEGHRLEALPLSQAEQRFERDFPGRLARFTDGRREIVLRWVTQPTRKLHPAVDCFKGGGFRVHPLPIKVIEGNEWGRFEAERKGERWEVREVIVDVAGRRWTDVSSWFWTAARERSGGWLAITVATSVSAKRVGAEAQFLSGD